MRNFVGLVLALLIAAGAGKALIDGPPIDGGSGESSFTLFEKQPASERKREVRPSDEPPPIECDDTGMCWWAEMGRPTYAP